MFGRRKAVRLASQALAERMAAEGFGPLVEGLRAHPASLMKSVTNLPKDVARTLGLDLPYPPRHLRRARHMRYLGLDLEAADAVLSLTGVEPGSEGGRGRYLYLDCHCGHAIRALRLVMPESRWVGLDRDTEAVTWATRHVPDASFVTKPAAPPVPYPDASFDGVVALDLAMAVSIEDVRHWLKELWRVVKPDGFLVTATQGHAALAQTATKDKVPLGALLAASKALEETGMAPPLEDDIASPLLLEDGFFRHVLNQHWKPEETLIGGGLGRADIHLARRLAVAPAPGLPNEKLESLARIAGLVSVRQLIDGTTSGGLLSATRIGRAGRIKRRSLVFMDGHAALPNPAPRLLLPFAAGPATYPAVHLAHLANARIVGQGSVIVSDGGQYHLLADSVQPILGQKRKPDGLVCEEGGRFAMRRQVHRVIDHCCLLLKRPWWKNFGHWLIDQAASLSYLVNTGTLPTRHIVVARVDAKGLREIMRQTIAAILPDAVILEHPDNEIWRFRQLAYLTQVHVPPLALSPEALECLRKDLLAASAPLPESPRRLHVLRPRALGRTVENEDEIIALSSRYGFTTVYPERHTLAEQVAMFNGAEAVLGVKGAALTNILFAPASCPLMVIAPNGFSDPFFWNIASVRGNPYGEVYGATTTDPAVRVSLNDFRVDPARLEAMIKSMLAPHPPIVSQIMQMFASWRSR